MPHKKLQLRFRIPWISGPSSKSHQSSEPKAKEKVVEEEEPIRVGKGNDIIKHGSLLTSERKMVFPSSSGKDIKLAASSDPVIREVSSISNDEKPIDDDISNFDHKLATVDEKRVSVMTLAGENRGATMQVAESTRKKNGSIHGEENSSSYVNSNIQSMNNSLISHGSINGRDPGVRVILQQQPEEDKQCFEKENPRPEVKIHRAERLNHVPTPIVRRRCLRGLLLEPSDSDPDNPDKPRRHGCKVSCGEVRNSG
ncbi:uncharacterized protein LOC130727736 [Lotus japonicus]|uniref:uncharacterized protein LOC130727736 n=1 Tax=Lotus japonicus TaxID=34305 RepID=UPI0025827E89|nr:uncharacterized protein LOC130727736 [Lotus japonicus]